MNQKNDGFPVLRHIRAALLLRPAFGRALRRGLLSAVFFCLLLLTACSGAQKETEPLPAGTYNIYYLDKNAMTLVPTPYAAEGSGVDELIPELMWQIMNPPSDSNVLPPTGDKVQYESYSLADGVLYLYFDEQYAELAPERETLCNAALTETLTQVAGVEHVGIYSDGQPLTTDTGIPLGPFAASDFVNSISNINSYASADLTLYFLASDGRSLAAETRNVRYRLDTSVEQLVIEQLIEGPQRYGSGAVIPPDTKLLSISVNDNVCYLNFSREFTDTITGVDPTLTIYAIVDSLSELDSVQRVQFAVEGSRDILFHDTISFDTLFERNLDYVSER